MSKNNVTLVVNFFVPKKNIPFGMFCTIRANLKVGRTTSDAVIMDLEVKMAACLDKFLEERFY